MPGVAGSDAHPDDEHEGRPDPAPVRGTGPEVHAAIDIGTNSVLSLIHITEPTRRH